jgi:hypothetical protein
LWSTSTYRLVSQNFSTKNIRNAPKLKEPKRRERMPTQTKLPVQLRPLTRHRHLT